MADAAFWRVRRGLAGPGLTHQAWLAHAMAGASEVSVEASVTASGVLY